jgi:Putative addiction module component
MSDKPDSMRDAAFPLPDEHQLYAAEIQRRIAEIRAGTAHLISADDALAQARQAVKNARESSRRR